MSRPPKYGAIIGLVLITALGAAPFVLEKQPVKFVAAQNAILPPGVGKVLVLAVMAAVIAGRAWADRGEEHGAVPLALFLAVCAGCLTACHWFRVDRAWVPDPQRPHREYYFAEEWQRRHYLATLNHEERGPTGEPYVPHIYRPLPYGVTRALECITGDWTFSCVAYRWFFTFWFLWAYYRFARLFCGMERSLLAVGAFIVLYPFSIWYYLGQLTDPLSHALFVLALIYAVEDRWLPLALSLALGVTAKETAAIIVPAYWACHWREGVRAAAKTAALGLVCAAAFAAVRLPWGWRLDLASINNTRELMVRANLGLGPALYRGRAPTYQNYLQPLLFVGVFLPFIAVRWRETDSRLKALFLVLTPLLLASNLCFGWLYESRNYVPLVPVLATMAVGTGGRKQ
jgi:hypothetical protein